MEGILLVDKSKGWTSFDIVAKVRSILKQSGVEKPKVGHAGTLDPLATGLLVILVGSYCKRASEYSKLDKTYEVELLLGQTSTTDDKEGVITKTNKPIPAADSIQTVIESFIGSYNQVPPKYSAIKLNGKRAYKLARSGKKVELKPRKVTIYSIDNIKTHKTVSKSETTVTFRVTVSSGTYIRSLVRDVGEKLGVGAYMSELRRTKVGTFNINDAHKIDSLISKNIGQKYV